MRGCSFFFFWYGSRIYLVRLWVAVGWERKMDKQRHVLGLLERFRGDDCAVLFFAFILALVCIRVVIYLAGQGIQGCRTWAFVFMCMWKIYIFI